VAQGLAAVSPFIAVYPWTGSGFGTKFADPTTIPATTTAGINFSQTGNYLVVNTTFTPYLFVYPWSASGFGTPVTNPAGMQASVYYPIFSPDNKYLAYGSQIAPKINVYPWDEATGTFGVKIANAASDRVGDVTTIAFSPL
jgi:hypothetical protein